MARKKYKFKKKQVVWIFGRDEEGFQFRRATCAGNYWDDDDIICLRGRQGTTWIERWQIGATKAELKEQVKQVIDHDIEKMEAELKRAKEFRKTLGD